MFLMMIIRQKVIYRWIGYFFQGVQVTLREVLNNGDDFIVIDNDFVIVKGHGVYLNHLRLGKEMIRYKKQRNIPAKLKLSLF